MRLAGRQHRDNDGSAQSKPLIHRFERVEMLFASRLIAMSIEVANIVLGGKLKGTTDRAAFERRRDEVIAARS